MSSLDTEAIRAREQAATPGPWAVDWMATDGDYGGIYQVIPNDLSSGRVADMGPFKRGWDDGQFIAHARSDVPALLNENRDLRTERDELRAEVTRLNDKLSAARLAGQMVIEQRDELRAENERLRNQPHRCPPLRAAEGKLAAVGEALGALATAFVEWEAMPNLYSPAFAVSFLREHLDAALGLTGEDEQ